MAKARLTFHPRLLSALKKYSWSDFGSDVGAGVTVGLVALPLAMAFAIASGLKPEAGIYTAIVAGFLISLFGGSRVQIGGPAGAFIVIVYGVVATYGVGGLMLATMLAGVMLLMMGAFRLGSLIRFVPVAIVTGFTNGIAVLIALSQVKDLLGLSIRDLPSDFLPRTISLLENLHTADATTVVVSFASAVVVFGWPLLARKTANAFMKHVPGSIVALLLGTAAVTFFALPVATIGTRFGGIPSSLPALSWPSFDLSNIQSLIRPAITIALLGAIESLLCARVADGLIGDRHDPNQELMAQGIANIASPLLGGYSATGTIARTVTNINSGAATPVAGIIHSLTLLFIVLLAAPLARNVPLATLGAILLYVSYNMGAWHEFARLRHFSMNYRAVLLTTFVLTVTVDLSVAVEAGLALACFFFVTRISSLTRLEPIPEVEAKGHAELGGTIEAYRLCGSLFFGSVNRLEELLDPKHKTPKILILSLTSLLSMDTSGLEALETTHTALHKKGCRLLISDVNGQPLSLMRRSGFLQKFGERNMFATTALALDHAGHELGQKMPIPL